MKAVCCCLKNHWCALFCWSTPIIIVTLCIVGIVIITFKICRVIEKNIKYKADKKEREDNRTINSTEILCRAYQKIFENKSCSEVAKSVSLSSGAYTLTIVEKGEKDRTLNIEIQKK